MGQKRWHNHVSVTSYVTTRCCSFMQPSDIPIQNDNKNSLKYEQSGLFGTIVSFFIFKFLEDISPFCGATDTPILDFWEEPYFGLLVRSALGFKANVDPLNIPLHAPHIHPGMIPADLRCSNPCTSIGGARGRDLLCRCLTVLDKTDAVPNELCRVGL